MVFYSRSPCWPTRHVLLKSAHAAFFASFSTQSYFSVVTKFVEYSFENASEEYARILVLVLI